MNDAFMLACSLSTWSGDERECRWCSAPLTGRQQRWCSQLCSGKAGAQHWWSAASRKARHERKECARCGPTNEPLEAHHIERANGRHGQLSCVHHAENIEVLCRPCHLAEHHGPHPDQMQVA